MLSDTVRIYKALAEDRYKTLRAEQEEDDRYYYDSFEVPQINSPVTIQRTGRAARLIDSPAEHIITSNPQGYRLNIKNTKGEEEDSLKISRVINEQWVYTLKHGNPDMFKEFVKQLLRRGDAYIKVLHNSSWVTEGMNKIGMPVIFSVPDAYTVYTLPEDEKNGIPDRALIMYKRSSSAIKRIYPDWSDPKGTLTKKQNADWLEYWTPEYREFYADGEIVLESDNVYGFVPLIHKLSGMGTNSADGALEKLIVGRLRFCRDTLARYTALVSSIDWLIHNFSNRSFDAKITDPQVDKAVFDTLEEDYKVGTGLMHKIPYGVDVQPAVQELPEPQLFAYLNQVENELAKEEPLVLGGMAVGESGRQQDMTQIAALRRYDTIVENTEHAFGQAFGMALRMMEKLPWIRPDDIPKDAINGNYSVVVSLKAADPLENDRKALLGSRMLAAGEIDPETNLIDFKGYTIEKARDVLVNTLKWKVLLNSPDIAELIGLRAAEQAGMLEQLNMLKQRRQLLEKTGGGLAEVPSRTSQERMAGEVQTPGGFEQIDMALTQRAERRPPTNYARSA